MMSLQNQKVHSVRQNILLFDKNVSFRALTVNVKNGVLHALLHPGIWDAVITNVVSHDQQRGHIMLRVPHIFQPTTGEVCLGRSWIDLSEYGSKKPKWLYEICQEYVMHSFLSCADYSSD